MAHRIMASAKGLRPLMAPITRLGPQATIQIRHGCILCKPPVPWLQKPSLVFSKEAVTHHWGALPIIIFTITGFTLECLYILRQSLTRDDVYYTKNPPPCEIVETRKGYPPPIRKMLTFNQKYTNPPGLIEAIQGDASGPAPADDGKKKKK
ncbi:uncharacterized protein LOC115625249 isoform X2 [Scaptodrosophila lebanonensis]|uniref:Uncharacterized protein LOC115625249 isoform X2 n=1 Tax=Drosophila lebanonensis TaxID=7225 RepID=A0A6J2TLU5_DROLE|nr:uncharacterized protein LOC115625249 isoform X2 [Scaptodrosophila lebanonensis]